MGAVPFAVRVLRHDAQDGERVEERVVGLVVVKLHHRVAHGHRAVYHGEVGLGRRALYDAVHGEGDIAGGEGLAIGKDDVVADGERPHQPIGGTQVLGGEIVRELKVLVRGDERGLDERHVNVLAAAPRDKRVEPRGGLARRVHGDDDLLGRIRGSGTGTGARMPRLVVGRAAAAQPGGGEGGACRGAGDEPPARDAIGAQAGDRVRAERRRRTVGSSVLRRRGEIGHGASL